MNLYLIITTQVEYDTYDSYVVCEKNEEEAKKWFPTTQGDNDQEKSNRDYPFIKGIELIGKSVKGLKKGCIIGSYNAG